VSTWLADVHFPDGRVRYSRYSTVVEKLVGGLHDGFYDIGETDDCWYVRSRREAKGEESRPDLSEPLSEPDELIPVRVEVDPDRMTWPALYCPRRNEIVPSSYFTARHVQYNFELIRQNIRLHLFPDPPIAPVAKRRSFLRFLYAGKIKHPFGAEEAKRSLNAEETKRTLCGEPAVGEIIPFRRYYFEGRVASRVLKELTGLPEPAACRNLYAEWSDGQVCRKCLLHDEALRS
jgi:hypothetical protein